MVWSGGTYKKGNFTTNGWTGDASLGIGIEAGRHDTQDDDFATGINQCLNKDGSNAATGNLNAGAYRVTNIGAGTARNDAAQVGQVQDGTLHWGSTSGGSANAQTLTLSPTVTAYVAGQRFSFLAGFTNTAAATLNVNGAGAKNIFNAATGAAIGAGEVISGRAYEVIYDGTQFLLLNDVTPIQNGDFIWLGTTAGTATVQTALATPAITAYKAGQKFRMLVGASLGSTSISPTAHTININGLGAKQIVSNDNLNSSPTIGSWVAGALLELTYDGTYFRITNDPSGWQTFTPSLSGLAPNVINTVNSLRARFIKRGKVVQIIMWQNFGITTGGGTIVQFNLPVQADNTIANFVYTPNFAFNSDSAGQAAGFIYLGSATIAYISRISNWTASAAGGAETRVSMTYEAA